MAIPFLYNNGTLVLFVGQSTRTVEPDHPSYGQIKKHLATLSEEELKGLLDVKQAVKSFVDSSSLGGRAEVRDGVVYFNGEALHNALATRTLSLMSQGLPFDHMLRFCENVDLNPSYQSALEGVEFLDNKGLPITEDGCFLAFKAVRNNYLDKYSGTIDNSPGQEVYMDRNKVNDNRDQECSKGLHCGALDYVHWYGNSDDKIVVVKVNPRDIVSVPKDHEAQKLRTCKYEVLHDFTGELKNPLYSSQGEDVSFSIDDEEYDWGFADDDEEKDEYPSIFECQDEDDCFEKDEVKSIPWYMDHSDYSLVNKSP